MDAFSFNIILSTVAGFLLRASTQFIKFPRKSEKREKIAKAISSIQKATINTRHHINNNGYQANTELSNLWTDALEKAIIANVDEEIPDYLLQKAKFWCEPGQWLSDPLAMEIVPKLIKIEEDCQMVLNKIME